MEKPKKNHYYVNWVDGMKINKSHFQQTDKANIALITKAIAITVNENRYGLLENLEQGHIELNLDSQNTLSVQLSKCKAITQGGFLIDISPETNTLQESKGKFITVNANLNLENNTNSNPYFVILNINPFDTISVGEANSEEEPLRRPYVVPKFSLHIINENQINDAALGDTFLIIGKIIYDGDTPKLDPNYIPPCYSVLNHKNLLQTYNDISSLYKSVEKYSLQIIQKIFQKKQSNELANMVLTISQNVWQYTAGIIPEYHIEDRIASPVKMITKLMALARIIKNSIDTYIGTGKEELVNYLVDWSNTTQGEFEKILDNMIMLKYKHYDINLLLGEVSKFSKTILSLFEKLEELDYIGKKSDSNIFVKEEVVVKQRRSFLLD